jgi:hypothetical protein
MTSSDPGEQAQLRTSTKIEVARGKFFHAFLHCFEFLDKRILRAVRHGIGT